LLLSGQAHIDQPALALWLPVADVWTGLVVCYFHNDQPAPTLWLPVAAVCTGSHWPACSSSMSTCCCCLDRLTLTSLLQLYVYLLLLSVQAHIDQPAPALRLPVAASGQAHIDQPALALWLPVADVWTGLVVCYTHIDRPAPTRLTPRSLGSKMRSKLKRKMMPLWRHQPATQSLLWLDNLYILSQ